MFGLPALALLRFGFTAVASIAAAVLPLTSHFIQPSTYPTNWPAATETGQDFWRINPSKASSVS